MKKIYVPFVLTLLVGVFELFANTGMSAVNPNIFGNTYFDQNVSDLKPYFRGQINETKNVFHLFSHGRSGALFIDGNWKNVSEIEKWLSSHVDLQKVKQINIYGCEFAKGEMGLKAVSYLEKKLGLTISASNNITGKDGDWNLEVGKYVSVKGLESYPGNLQCPAATASDPDTDGDGVPDSVDIDDDNDGILDVNEGVTKSANAIVNGNFGTDETSGGNLANWNTNGTGTNPPDHNWIAGGGGAVVFYDGAEGLNLEQSITFKPTISTPLVSKITTFSIRVYPINAGGGTPTNESWGKMTLFVRAPDGTLLKLFTVYNQVTADINSPTVSVTDINSTVVQNLSVNGNLSSRSFATNWFSTISVSINSDLLATMGSLLVQRNNGAASGPNGVAGSDDFLIDDLSYTAEQYTDTDGDGVPNHGDLDSDNDGIPDAIEACGNRSVTLTNCRVPYNAGTDTDANGDGCRDGRVMQSCTTPKQSDGDTQPDYLDLDSDGDGCPDATEAQVIGTVNTTFFGAPSATANGLTNSGCSSPPNTNWINNAVKGGCLDTDADGVLNTMDLDDDNDGVLDATESPSCFYTETEAKQIISVTSALTQYATFVITNSYDGNTATQSAFSPSQNWVGKSVFEITPTIPLSITKVNLDLGSWYLSENSSSTFKLQGWTGAAWEDLSAPMSNYNSTVDFSISNTIRPNTVYIKFRIVGVAGTCYYSGVNEITLTANQYIASANPKSTCLNDTDGDTVPNHWDLDSDGDSCSDALEAGATTNTTANFQFPAAPDANANGLNDNIENGTTGTINYISTYNAYATSANLAACVDTDGDGINDLLDIDDDNDGVLDATESPSCFYTETEARKIASVTTELMPFSSTYQIAHSYDNNTATWFAFQSNQDWVGKSLFEITPTIALAISSVNFNVYTWPFSNGAASTFKLQGWDGSVWVDLSSAMANTSAIDFSINNSLHPTTVYSKYRIVGVAGTSNNAGVREITLTATANQYVASANPKPTCATDTDGDTVPNHRDLDSDGDGCSDLAEAGVSPLTDVSTPASATNSHGQSYGIAANKLTGSQLNPAAADANNNGLNDAVENGTTGRVNYPSTYRAYATSSALNACADSDGDGIKDLLDIDDDNDGILDAKESPSCFYTSAEANTIAKITSEFTSPDDDQADGNIELLHDGSTDLMFNFNDFAAGANPTGSNLFTIQFPTPVKLATLVVSNNISSTANANAVVVGSNDGLIWSGALTAATLINTTPVSFTITAPQAYKYYKIQTGSVPGALATGNVIGEITSTLASNYIPSANPKPTCVSDTDGDTIPNHRDLDSDGDGCSDLAESGVSPLTDLGTPASATNSNGQSYGIAANKLAGSQLNPGAADANNNGLNDTVENGTTGTVNYSSTYTPNATRSDLNTCADSDGDGIKDLQDIDDDNDGILDEKEQTCPAVSSTPAITSTFGGVIIRNDNFFQAPESPSTITIDYDYSFQKVSLLVSSINSGSKFTVSVQLDDGTIVGPLNSRLFFSASDPAWSPIWTSKGYPDLSGNGNWAGQIAYNNSDVSFSSSVPQSWGALEITAPQATPFFGIDKIFIQFVTGTSNGLFDVAPMNIVSSCTDIDTDNDGVPNRLDLDSDGDGCSDLAESGVSPSTDISTPASATNNFEKSYGIAANKLTGSQLNPAGTDNNNDGLNDSVDPDGNRIPNYPSTYPHYALANNLVACADTDGDGKNDITDIDDDNDGVLDATESPSCFYTANEWNTIAKPFYAVTISSALTTTTSNFSQLIDGVSNVTAVTFSASPAQDIANRNVYLFNFANPVRLNALYLQFNTATQFAGTTKIQGSNNGSDWVDLSAAIAATAGTNTTANGAVTVANSIKYPVTLNTANAYKYIRITGVAASNIAAQNASEVYFDFNTSAYVPSSYPKSNCVNDTDNDGISNHQDLDSDGDGCTDAFEAGTYNKTDVVLLAGDVKNGSGGNVTSTISNPQAKIAGDYGANGFADVLETSGNGIYKYTYDYANALNASVKTCCSVIADNTIASNQAVCSTTTPQPLIGSVPTLSPASTSTIQYRWMRRIPGTTTDFEMISGATSKDYTFSGPLTETTDYRRVAYVAGCSPTFDNTSATVTITVTATPTAGTLSGTTNICIGGTTTLTVTGNSAPGTWSSGNTAVATVNATTGAITGVSAGTSNIIYTVQGAGGCDNATTMRTITVMPNNTVSSGTTTTVCINGSLSGVTHSTTGATGIGTATGLPAGVMAAWSSNTITFSGTPTESGTFPYSIPLTGGCGEVNATGTITVTPANTVSSGTTTTVCINGSLSGVTHSTTGATGIGMATGLPAGVMAAWSSNTITFSGTPTESGTFPYSIPLTGGCGEVNATGTITVTPANTVSSGTTTTVCINGSLSGVTHSTTGATGIGTATGLPAGLMAAWSSNTITFSGTPTESGTFPYSIPLTGGCGEVNATGTITVMPNNTVSSGTTTTVCINGSLSGVTHSTTGATGIGTATGLPTGVMAAWSSNTITFSGAPTESGTFPYSIPLTGGCGEVNATGTITVMPNNTVSSGTTTTVCINGSLSGVTHSTTGATGIGTATGLPTGVMAAWSSNTITFSGAPTESGTFPYSIPLTGGCGEVNATGTITVMPNNTVSSGTTTTICINGSLSGVTHSTTGATGIGTATGLPAGVMAAWSSNTITFSGTPTESGTFPYSIPLTGGCGDVNATGTITVMPNNTVSSGTTTTICINGSLSGVTHSTTGATGIGMATGLPAGVMAAWSSNTITFSGTPTESGTFPYSIPLTGGCGEVNATGTITVTPANTVSSGTTTTVCINGSLSGVTHSTTGATGIGTATGLPTGVMAAWSSNTITINGTPTESGTFPYSIPLTGGCGEVNATGTITVTPANTVSSGTTTTICINGSLSGVTHSTTGATGIGTATGLPAGVMAAWSSNTITFSGTPTESGTFPYSIPLTGGCGEVNATGTITVKELPMATISGTATICSGTETTITISGTPNAVVTYKVNNGTPQMINLNSSGAANLPTGNLTTTTTYSLISVSNAAGEMPNCSKTLSGSATITVTEPPNAGILSGAQKICVDGMTTFTSNGDSGGSWVSNNTSIATVDATGVVTAHSVGTATITYMVSATSPCTTPSSATRNIEVMTQPYAGVLEGNTKICMGGNTLFTPKGANGSGTWASSNGAVASIDPSTGVVTGNSSGTATISYTVTGGAGCTSSTSTVPVMVGTTTGSNAGTLSGDPNICIGGSTTFTANGASGSGTWSTSDADIATINGSGEIKGVAAGTAMITYTVAGSGGCDDAFVSRMVTVHPNNTVGAASIMPSVCENSEMPNITHSTTGATGIGTAMGLPAGVTAGWSSNVITISGTPTESGTFNYSIALTGGCGTENATGTITVTAPPVAGTLDGEQEVCVGSTTTFTSTHSGGTWMSANTGIATIDASTGVITGVSAGSATITYTVAGTGNCSNATATRTVMVTAPPDAGTLNGMEAICIEGTTTFTVSGNSASGSWSSDHTGIATVNTSTGLITGISAGTATIIYTVHGTGRCSDATATRTITVTAPPVAGTLDGEQEVCVGGTTTFTATGNSATGVWSSDNTGVATVDNSTGLITGKSIGTATITYTVTGEGNCSNAATTRTVMVTAAPSAGTLNGNQNICLGGNTVFKPVGANGKGTWSSSNESVATIDASTGVVTGVTSGMAAISYTVTGGAGCASETSMIAVTVGVAEGPKAGKLSGKQDVCVGNTTRFTVTGNSASGTWSSSDAGVATVDASTGVITGISIGTATITYTVPASSGSSCNDAFVSRLVHVYAMPEAGTIKGPQNVCIGGTTTFTVNGNSATGTWSSSDAGIATVNASTGVIKGIAAGTATISYTVPGMGGCSDALATRTVMVAAPPVAGNLNGKQEICQGSTTTFTSTHSGGTWSSDHTAVATINASTGVIMGIAAGKATITYSVAGTGGCGSATATRMVTVTSPPIAGSLDGMQGICVGGTTTFTATDNSGMGSWSSDNTGIATVDASTGVITGVSAGSATITYTMAGSGGCSDASATRTVMVAAPPVAGTLGGEQKVCEGSTTTFTSTHSGGTWSADNTAIATIDASTGVITGVAAGTATITYTVAGAGGCGSATATRMLTVIAPPAAGMLSGMQSICIGGTTTFTATNNSSMGNWSSNNIGIATVDSSTGVITGVAAGTATITYTMAGTGGCGDATATRMVTVTSPPVAGTLDGEQQICVGSTTTFTSTHSGGTWSVDHAGVATINASTGVITGIAAGTATITYTMAGTGGCDDATATRTVMVAAPPVAGTLEGEQQICAGNTTTFTSTHSGGIWSVDHTGVATIDASTGVITGIAAGTATITYTMAGTGGCGDATATRTVMVAAPPVAGTLDGEQQICAGNTTTFTSTHSGGTWSVDHTGVATIDASTGVITGIAAGTATITYTMAGTGGCGDATATRMVTVTSPPMAGTLSGTQTVCSGSTTMFSSNGDLGGTWSTSDSGVATVNASTGAITGISAGMATITYSVAGKGNCSKATATRTVTVTPATTCASIIVLKRAKFNDTDSNGSAEVGETITYTFTVKNTGSLTLTDITISDPLVTVAGRIASLAPGKEDATTFSAVYLITQADVDAGSVSNQALANSKAPDGTAITASSDDPATVAANDSTTISLPQKPVTDLSIIKTVDNAAPVVGSNVTFTITVQNAGPADATGVVVSENLPSGYRFISASTSGTTTYTDGTWSIGNLANGANATLTIVAAVKLDGNYANTVNVASATVDKMMLNNTATATPVPVPNKPIANDNETLTDANKPIVISILEDDESGNSTFDLTTIEIVEQPVYGKLIINVDGTVTYIPNPGFTGIDKFTYRLKDAQGNYTNVATVTIKSNFIDLKIPNLFTPNGDGNNDTFEIIGLNQFKENTLVILSRWGNEVYRMNSYQNNWTGDGLNEGTYYYLLKARNGDDPNWVVYKGWLTLIREFKK
ncbi:Ig-like domain-containing protein [Pedobacter endophyticus]|uniref:Ig-like domain-containing protein n=1 Tax=Pedobacter endophyticus TaxID=2789740 RepID=A0A7U3Q5I8_9SPHI|nr:Ig-like domain-containing protein [Pedobacter endophyticus]QPH38867.1 Ig-like domain-containing protein [Pedobacter endophyticus]